MRLQAKVIITEQYLSPKSGKNYVTALDLETGGMMKFTLPGEIEQKATLVPVAVTVDVKPGLSRDGGLYLTGNQIEIKPAG